MFVDIRVDSGEGCPMVGWQGGQIGKNQGSGQNGEKNDGNEKK